MQYNKTAKWLTSLIVIYILHLPIGCNDSCVGTNSFTTITELEASFAALNQRILLDRDSTTLDSAALVVTITDAEIETSTIAGFTGLSSVAVAEDCAFNVSLKNKLEAITITSPQAINIDGVDYEPGADLVSLFEVAITERYQDPYPVAELLLDLEREAYGLSDIGQSLYFQLVGTPSSDVRQAFTFGFQFSDRMLTATSDEVIILVE
ncbi:MAG: hypothetical protein AAFO69_04965 [Bacteroidota bacterium]